MSPPPKSHNKEASFQTPHVVSPSLEVSSNAVSSLEVNVEKTYTSPISQSPFAAYYAGKPPFLKELNYDELCVFKEEFSRYKRVNPQVSIWDCIASTWKSFVISLPEEDVIDKLKLLSLGNLK